MKTSGRRLGQGFTLLEMLVALVVLGFLMGGLAEAVRAGLSLRHVQAHRLAETADLDSTMRLLRLVLTRLPTSSGGDRLFATATGVGFNGRPERVIFVGNLPTGTGTMRTAEITLDVENGHLVLSWRPHLHERPLGVPPPVARTVLLDGIRRFDLAYWGSPSKNEEPRWHSRWESPQAPQLVRVRLGFAEDDPRRWPDLIAAPRL